MSQEKQEDTTGASGFLGLILLTVAAIGGAYGLVYAVEWLMGN